MPDSEVLLPSVAKPAVAGSKRRRIKRKGNPVTGSKMGSGSTAASISSDKVRITECATAMTTATTTTTATATTASNASSKKQSRKSSTSRQDAQKEMKGGQTSVALTPSTAVVSMGCESRPSSTASLDTLAVTPPPPPLPPQLHSHPSLLVKETHAPFNEHAVSEYSLTPSLLDEVLSQKKLRLLRSPDVVKFFKQRQQQTLLANSRSVRGLGQLSVTTTTNVADRTHYKN